MSSNPKVTVIIPSYNYALYLPESIGSVINQTYENLECIVIDDGSADNTKEVVEQISAKDNRVKYYRQSNSGPTVARNYGLKLASGEFIQFLDADDLIEKSKLEKQIAIFNKNIDVDIVYSGVKYFDSSNPSKLFDNMDLKSGPWMKNLSGSGDIMIMELLSRNIMVISSPLVRKSVFEKFGNMNELLQYNEDWELWARFAIGKAKFYFDNSTDTRAIIRVHSSYSTDNFKMFAHGLKACFLLSEKIVGRKYRKIMIPKINYHMRIIDEKLIKLLSTNKEKAIENSLQVYEHTGVGRYLMYSKLFNNFPVWFCYLYSRFLFIINKLKNVIVYA